MSSANLSLDVHHYDGKLIDLLLPFRESFLEASKVSKEEKITVFRQFQSKITDTSASHNLNTIIASIGQASNCDPSNNIKADDILWLLIKKLDSNQPVPSIIIEAIGADMSTGMCPQGRTHRLFQLLLAFDLE
jgi:hypothetical protein